ncbi:MAG TPA: MgtC/SapB family protein [Saprospiraceae bacterium]|nr:MgtC/SapB family protein [Saprospiraceae bacterium]
MDHSNDFICLLHALAIGSLLGLEREYRQKPAGFRTIALITVASTLFTLLSIRLGGGVSPDRVAANILTGVGFIGAGIIFREKGTVRGLTTAATVWAAASLGMAAGLGVFSLAWATCGIVLIVLEVFEIVQEHFLALYHSRKCEIIVRNPDTVPELESMMHQCGMRYKLTNKTFTRSSLTLQYQLFGKTNSLSEFENRLRSLEGLDGYKF